jgi:2-C-methyl-D-erythritol 4-phosphate cytidylyltransferase/2-C-methyl-D-erythritol 2,4-cyclodiphosphate synthase
VPAVRAVIARSARARSDAATAGLARGGPVPGGALRQDSVRHGLESLSDIEPEKVLIHDGARPFVEAGLISDVLDALTDNDGAIAALPVTDTLKRAEHGHIAATLDRTGLWHAQTPQGFRYRAIRDAHRQLAGQDLTDDAAVAETAGLTVRLVPGSDDNLKITSAGDLDRAERLLAARAGIERVGFGFDVHRFEPGDEVMLCGIAVPHDARLAGHSDADVGLHAVTDALLGAIAAGDIGSHFPPNDPQWRGADSSVFVGRAVELIGARGGDIVHVDVTLICERPKIGPHRAHMVERLASLLGVPPNRVSVKATTTEGLGFTGRGEGIAAQAVATVRLPD